MGALVILAATVAEALAIFDACTREKGDISIRDPEGKTVDAEVLRSILKTVRTDSAESHPRRT
jgi:hypothetical protein